MGQLITTSQKRARKKRIILAFLLGVVAGAAAMFCAGFLYLRHNLIVSYDFPGLTADDFDDAFENAMPAESGWRATREACSLPLPSDGRAVNNWKLCNYTHFLIRFVYLIWHHSADEPVEAVEVGITAVALIHQDAIDGLPMALLVKQRLVAILLLHQQ